MKTLRENDRRFSGSVEELLLRLGFLVVIAWLASCVVAAYYVPEHCVGVLKAVGFHALGGRAAGISKGIDAGLPGWLVVTVSFATEVAVVFMLYPLVVYSYERGARRWFMRGAVESTVEAAESGRKRLSRWGIAGIIFFVWFPFYMTGPLVGSVIGYFLGLRAWVTMCAVGGGTFIAIVCWTFLFDRLIGYLKQHAEGASSYVPVAVVSLVLAGLVLARIRMYVRRRRRAAGASDGAPQAGKAPEDG